jgi:hypothetical protein
LLVVPGALSSRPEYVRAHPRAFVGQIEDEERIGLSRARDFDRASASRISSAVGGLPLPRSKAPMNAVARCASHLLPSAFADDVIGGLMKVTPDIREPPLEEGFGTVVEAALYADRNCFAGSEPKVCASMANSLSSDNRKRNSAASAVVPCLLGLLRGVLLRPTPARVSSRRLYGVQ